MFALCLFLHVLWILWNFFKILHFSPQGENVALANAFYYVLGVWNGENQLFGDFHQISLKFIYLVKIMKFSEFNDFHDF